MLKSTENSSFSVIHGYFLILKYHIRGINGQRSAVFCGKYLLNSANVLTFAAG
jgi:hypothetical protein